MYVSEICAEGIFVAFPCWLKNVKSRSKIALFSNERHFAIWFPKKKTITFFWSKLSKLHKKDPILHVATTFSLKQGETRTSHGPIPHPLRLPMSALATVARKSFNGKFTAKVDFMIGHFMLPLMMLTLEVYSLSIHYLVSIWTTCWWNLNEIVWFELYKILSFLTKRG